MRILAVDISGVFSQMWEVDSGKGRDFDKPRTATINAIRRFREGHDRVAICCDSGKVGGESGSKARECNPSWLLQVVEACQEHKVPVFVKQLGANPEPRSGRCAPIRRES